MKLGKIEKISFLTKIRKTGKSAKRLFFGAFVIPILVGFGANGIFNSALDFITADNKSEKINKIISDVPKSLGYFLKNTISAQDALTPKLAFGIGFGTFAFLLMCSGDKEQEFDKMKESFEGTHMRCVRKGTTGEVDIPIITFDDKNYIMLDDKQINEINLYLAKSKEQTLNKSYFTR